MNLQVFLVDPRTLWVQSEEPFPVPYEIKEIPGVRFEEHPKVTRLTLPSTVWGLKVIESWVSGVGFDLNALRTVELMPSDRLSDKLYPHQRLAERWLLEHGGGLLGDQMGLGKSLTALSTAARISKVRDNRPVLICAPKSVRNVWRNELLKFDVPGKDRWVQLEGLMPDVEKVRSARWVFCHYDIIKAWWSQIVCAKPCCVIMDEAHLLKNGRTQRGKAAQLAASVAEHRILLTGTPILNRIGEMWHLLTLVSGKWSWGTPRDFRTRYCGATWNGYTYEDQQPTRVEELQTRLEGVYLRRTVESSGVDLPEITRQVIEVDLDEHWAIKYKDLFQEYDPEAVLRAILRRSASQKTIRWLGRLRKITSSAKFNTTAAEAQSLLEQDESIVIFVWQRKTAERLAQRLRHTTDRVRVVHGGFSQKQRDHSVDEFQDKGGALIATIDALSVGVTLTKARVVMMHDLSWVPADMLQAEQRIWRIGQTKPCLSKWIVARNTLDQMVLRAFSRKAQMVEAGASDLSVTRLSEVLDPTEVNEWLRTIVRWAKEK